jgi:hypothetical protein
MQHHNAVAPPAYDGTGGSGNGGRSSDGATAGRFPLDAGALWQLTAAAGVVQDLTVQVEHHLAASI